MSNRLVKFTGRLTVDTQTFTIVRDDAGGSGTPATITVPDGDYYILGRSIAIIDGNQSGLSTIDVELGHGLVVGDVVSVRDISGDTDIATSRTITAVPTPTSVTISGATLSVADGDEIYIEDDLLSVMCVLAHSDTPADFLTLGASINSEGIITLSTTGSVVIEAEFGSDLKDWLRYPEDLVSSDAIDSDGKEADRTHAFGFYPSKLNIEDKPSIQAQRSISVATDGTQETLYLAKQSRLLLTVRYSGGPRSYTWREIHAFDDFWSRAVQGIPFRYYANTSQERGYQVKVYPYGWKSYTLESPDTWEPREITAGWYEHFQESLVLLAYTE